MLAFQPETHGRNPRAAWTMSHRRPMRRTQSAPPCEPADRAPAGLPSTTRLPPLSQHNLSGLRTKIWHAPLTRRGQLFNTAKSCASSFRARSSSSASPPRHLRRLRPAHDDDEALCDEQAGGGPAARRMLAAVAARAPFVCSAGAHRPEFGLLRGEVTRVDASRERARGKIDRALSVQQVPLL